MIVLGLLLKIMKITKESISMENIFELKCAIEGKILNGIKTFGN